MSRMSCCLISFLFVSQAAFAEEKPQQNSAPNWSLGAGIWSTTFTPSVSIERRFSPRFFIGAQFQGNYKTANAYQLELPGASGQTAPTTMQVPQARSTILAVAILPRWILTNDSSPVEISALGSISLIGASFESSLGLGGFGGLASGLISVPVGGTLLPMTDSLTLSAGAGIAAEYKFNAYLAVRASTILASAYFGRWMKVNRNEFGAGIAFEPALDLRFYF